MREFAFPGFLVVEPDHQPAVFDEDVDVAQDVVPAGIAALDPRPGGRRDGLALCGGLLVGRRTLVGALVPGRQVFGLVVVVFIAQEQVDGPPQDGVACFGRRFVVDLDGHGKVHFRDEGT